MAFTAEQLAERKKGIGGSDAPCIFGYGYLSTLELYFRKRGQIDDSAEQNEAMFWGTVLEEPIADVWAERKGVKIRRVPVMQWSKEYPWMFCSIDRHIMGDAAGPGVLEVKNFNEWRGKELDERDLDTVPLGVRIQAMHGMAVFDWTWAEIAILVGGNRLYSWRMERDEEAVQTLIEQERLFMESVKAGIPPEPNYRAADVLSGVYAQGGGEAVTVQDGRVLQIGRDAIRYRDLAKEYAKEFEQRKNAIKLYMGNAECCGMPGVGEFTWKKTKDKSVLIFDEATFKAENPSQYKAYLKKIPKPGHRTFRMKTEEDAADVSEE
ncbi:MAG: YqaJ viral recombinase family protein [Candidatus Krumholzibacteria bacterium]|nr:YqaJ viral recombinase family protein [Candidatus Krumholzibacteria bacterium]